MCGRTCLTLEPQQILCACKYKKVSTLNNNNNSIPINKQTKSGVESKDEIKKEAIKDEEANKEEAKDVIIKAEPLEEEDLFVEPEWRKEYNCGLDYTPCFNIAPQSVTPVIVSSQHFSDAGGHERVIMPMLWGMIPFWHRGDFRKHGLTTNNCRLEHMLESKLYEGPFRRGQRCVVLCEGFYEWQTTKSAKPSERNAYLLYMPQQDGVQIWNKSTWLKGDGGEVQNNLNLLKLAGIFDVWTDSQGDKIYSYSVITFESSNIMSWLHHRMPAILETEQQVDDWLDYKRVPYKAALGLLRPATSLKWHRVSKLVNNSRNKDAECNVPIEMIKSEKPKTNMLTSWLLTRKRISEEMEKQHADSSGTSDSEDGGIAFNSKRPRFHDYKKLKTKGEE